MFIAQIVLRFFGLDVNTEQEKITKKLEEEAKKNKLKKIKNYSEIPIYYKGLVKDNEEKRGKEEVNEWKYSSKIDSSSQETVLSDIIKLQPINLIPSVEISGFTVDLEMIKDKGEDAPPILLEFQDGSKILAVADGMGGAGGTIYDIDNTKRSGAYLASRAVNSIAEKYFLGFKERGYDISENNYKSIAEDLKYHFDSGLVQILNEIHKRGNSKLNIKSSMIKRLPTTFALSYVKDEKDKIKLYNYWAGDSRIYSLDDIFGLRQLVSDDLKNSGDAYENLVNDSPISNCINADKAYQINVNTLEIHSPAIVFAASDGAFAYLQTPIHFEYLLVKTLVLSADVNDWKVNLEREFQQYPSDDISLSVTIIGYDNFDHLKTRFYNRNQVLENELDALNLVSANLQKQKKEVDEVNKIISENKSRVTLCESREANANEKFIFLTNSINSLEYENRKSENLIEVKKREILEIERLVKKRTEEIVNSKTEIEIVEKELSVLKNDLAQLRKENVFEFNSEVFDKFKSLKEAQEKLKKELWLKYKEQYELFLIKHD